MHTDLEKNTVQYILRPGLPVLEDEALWQETLKFAKDTQMDAILAFNGHGEMPPHPNEDYIRKNVDLLAKRFAEIRALGMTPMLNYFVTLGHGEAKPAAGMDHFQWIVDGHGNQSIGCPCPLDESFQDYMCKAFGLYAQLDVESIWIDDDFRLFAREGTDTLQCFCKLHLGRFADKLGRYYERDEVMERLMQKPADRAFRKAWFAVQGQSMRELARKLRDAVEEVNANTGMGVMFCAPYSFVLSGIDLNEVMPALSTSNSPRPWLRTGGNGAYRDERPLDILHKIVTVADPIPAMVDKPIRLCCEIENYPFATGIKSARVLALEMYLNTISTNGWLTLSILDNLFGIHDPSGNVVPMLNKMKAYLVQVAAVMEGKARRGASLPFPAHPTEVSDLTEDALSPHWNVTLARLGIPQAPTAASPILFTGRTTELYNDEEIKALLQRGSMMDPESYLLLQERGILTGEAILVKAEPFHSKVQSERVNAGNAPEWLKGKSLLTRWHIDYNTQHTIQAGTGGEALSALYDTQGNWISDGVVFSQSPYSIAVVTHNGKPMKESGRQWLFSQLINRITNSTFPVMVEGILELYPVWWEKGKESVLGLCNFGIEEFPEVSLWLPGMREYVSIEQLGSDGIWKMADYRISEHPDGGIRLTLHGDSVPKHLSFETFLLKL
ncbi:hypothetical protein [Cohnella silvisoli]|uniref:Beta-galactosidase trimerisation domain-containing protein n=1 Tax=Cohnella silvisoli TaxID=2873699 RepID=A0ABV1KYJ4_9BACL|nr:hypothetical protein [Cohnella silvisoli]MCD9023829.1 hypothetical protein [Cohnella silvisoli]